MNIGQIISGAGHIGLIGWVLFGGAFPDREFEFDAVQAVTVSSEEYAEIVARSTSPEQTTEIAPPAAPEVPQDAPDLTSAADTPPDAPQPTPAPEAAPDPAPTPPPAAPQADVADEAPVIEQPSQDMAALVPESSPRPQQRPAERVAPQAAPQPEPDVAVDDVVREEAVPDEAGETVSEETEATAPEAAATEIVTEAEEAEQDSAPLNSVRPRTRPQNLQPAPQPEPETQTATADPAPEAAPEPDPAPAPAPSVDSSSVNDALAAALGGAAETPAPSINAGPPLTAGEKDGLRVAVQSCWNTGSLSSDALRTVVTVSFEMSEDARPIESTLRMTDSSGGTAGSAQQAYEAARRAILRCGARGFGLPVEKFASWQNVELVFNPENMRIK
ncbi:Cell division and transport-associated protein TolA [Roseovarius nanhaiticus]|uniref:Cell division and transport-associated protein TolA n=1 Tax=Roseovarius nanhaiticus TaxID=573024 RepID=A0A1N7H5T7_9RHOB|nr:energy transducer TonB [Roseovarius nanhaiticus]SEL12347.1 Cell division and transport-associated protein TolA [Roseovarius nanhaiticus]SIS20028.1 Cell division and transport-associated protein TolA [Roseovarius nanhaiticus]